MPARSRREARRPLPAASSVARVALFFPWISVAVIAELLPEPELVLLEHAQAAHPLRALPEIEMRDQQPRGAAVLGRQWLAVVAIDDPRLAAGHVGERQVRRVAAVAEREDEVTAHV